MARYTIRFGRRRTPVLLVVVLAVASWWSLQHDRNAAAPAQQQAGSVPATDGATLDSLPVAPEAPMDDYQRDRFGDGWRSHGRGCDTRELVLQRGNGVQLGDDCKPTAGRWTSLYDGTTVTDPSRLDIDHVVPLAEAWRSGAADWSPERRESFANDLNSPQLVAVSAASNRTKGDQDPARWRPSDRGYWCTYAHNYVTVKAGYGLSVDRAERNGLADMLAGCPR